MTFDLTAMMGPVFWVMTGLVALAAAAILVAAWRWWDDDASRRTVGKHPPRAARGRSIARNRSRAPHAFRA